MGGNILIIMESTTKVQYKDYEILPGCRLMHVICHKSVLTYSRSLFALITIVNMFSTNLDL